MNAPLAIDLFCGLGGWTEGLLSEGYRVVGFDIEAHDYGDGKRYPAQLVIQDVLTIHGRQFKDAALIVASPPCQEYSYMAMPWSRAKAIAAEYRSGKRDTKKLTALFDACFRIQREAIEAAGHFIPMVVENVRGAQPWVGRARWNFGSYYLWGDVPALMPITMPRRKSKVGSWDTTRANYNPDKAWDDGHKGRSNFHQQFGLPSPSFHGADHELSVQRHEHMKNNGVKAGDRNKGAATGEHKWTASFADNLVATGFKTQGMNWSDRSIKGQDFTRVAGQQAEGVKGSVGYERSHPMALGWKKPGTSSHSKARKAASATIAKIPLTLARWIAKVYKPVPSPRPALPLGGV